MIAALRKKIARRIRARDRQVRRYRRTKKRGHARAAKRHGLALQHLRRRMAELRAVDERTDTSDAGVQFISEFEGFYAEPYNDPAGFATVGFGHLLGYRPVSANDRKAIWIDGQETPGRLTQDEARRLLARELSQTYEPPVRALFLDGGPLAGKFEQSLFDALVSFAYNLGPGAVTPGTSGFETVGRAIQSGSRNGIADSLLLYDRAGGQQLPGLTRRRRAERRLIRAGNYSTTF